MMSKSDLKEIYPWQDDDSLPFDQFLLNYRGFEKGHQAFFFGCGVKKKKGLRIDWEGGVYDHFALIVVLNGRGRFIDHNGVEHLVEAGSVFLRSSVREHQLYIDPRSDWHECFIALKHIPLDRTDQTVFSDEMVEIPQGKLWLQYQTAPSETDNILKYLIDFPEGQSVFKVDLNEKRLRSFYTLVTLLEDAKVTDVHRLQESYLNFIRSMCVPKGILAGQNNPLVRDLMRTLQENIHSSDSIPDLLSDIPASYSKIRRIFKQETGTSLGQCYLQLKMEEAIALLKNGLSLKDIAEKLSYSDQFAFSSQFKKYTGVSPKNFLKKMVL